MFPAANATIVRIYTGMNITRIASTGGISAITWVDGSIFSYGNPLANSFAAGTEPWMNGSVTGGQNEPKNSTSATCGGIIRNGNTGGAWSTLSCTTNAYYICKFKATEYTKVPVVSTCPTGYTQFDGNCYKV